MKHPVRVMEAVRNGEAEQKRRKGEEPARGTAAEQEGGRERELGVEQEQKSRVPGSFQVRMIDWFRS